MVKFLKRYGIAILCGVLAFVLLTISFHLFAKRARRMVDSVSESFVGEKAGEIATSYTYILENHVAMLNACVELFNGVNLKNVNSMAGVIKLMRGVGLFKTVGVFMEDGTGVDNEGNVFGNFSNSPEYLEPMKGKSFISDLIIGLDGRSKVMLLCVPIMRGGEPRGVLFGVLDKAVLQEVIREKDSDSFGEIFILTRDGTILASSDETVGSVPGENDSYFNNSSDWIRDGQPVTYVRGKIFDVREQVAYRYSVDRDSKFTIVTPINKCSLVLAVVLQESTVRESTRMMGGYMLLLILSVIVAFSLLLFALVSLAKSDSELVRRNEKYEIASKQNRSIIFDYDSYRKRLELSGSYEILTGNKEAVYENGRERFILDLIHEDDTAIRDIIQNLAKRRDVRVNAEARLKCADGSYQWFKIKANVVRNTDGTIREIVGNLSNVEERAIETGVLKLKDDLDAVTGLYNKEAFISQVNEKLANAVSGSMYALYMIDVDNFGSVNDVLGHTIGDRVLSSIAGKIGRVFTDKDCIGRIKGDEFGVLLLLAPETKRLGQRIIEDKAYRLCKTMDETYSDGENDVRISVSVGVSCFPDDGSTYEELYRRADAALYAAKHSGKNQCCIYRNGGVDG